MLEINPAKDYLANMIFTGKSILPDSPELISEDFKEFEDRKMRQDFYNMWLVAYGSETTELRFLDEEVTVFDKTFGEVDDRFKIYKNALKVPSQPNFEPELPTTFIDDIRYSAEFAIPIFALSDKPILTVEEENLYKKAELWYAGREYEIKALRPVAPIDGFILFYKFLVDEKRGTGNG